MDEQDLALVQAWRNHLRVEGKSPNTIKMWTCAIRVGRRHTGVPVLAMTPDLLCEWLAGYASAQTRASYLGAWRSLDAFAKQRKMRKGRGPTKGVRRPKVPVRAPNPMPDYDLAAMVAAAKDAWDREIVLLGVLAGCRREEITRVHTDDVDLAAGTLRIVGKGDKERFVPLHPLLREVALTKAPGWWFPSPRRAGRPLDVNTVHDRVKRMCRRAGIKEWSAHPMRHSFATNALATGTDVRVLQVLMGHANITDTQRYAAVSLPQMRAAINRLTLPDLAGGRL